MNLRCIELCLEKSFSRAILSGSFLLFLIFVFTGTGKAQYSVVDSVTLGGSQAMTGLTYTLSSTISPTGTGSSVIAVGGNSLVGLTNPIGRPAPAISVLPPNTSTLYGYKNVVTPTTTITSTFVFNHKVYNPIIHIAMLGPSSIGVTGMNGATSITSVPITKLVGNNNVNSNAPSIIDGSTSGGGGDCGTTTAATQGCGSFMLMGEFTTIVLTHNNPSSSTSDGYFYGFSVANEYGDAPSTFGDAVHVIDTMPSYYMGASAPDFELETPYSVNADGDDLSISDDEDGVILPAIRSGQTIQIPVIVKGTGGFLNAWMDFNGNGVFDASESVSNNIMDGGAGDGDPTAGKILVSATIPYTSVPGTRYARFRWSPISGSLATGPAFNGEVEDYVFTLAGSPLVGLLKSCLLPANCLTAPQNPLTDLTFKIEYTNNGNAAANTITIVDGIPTNTEFKVGSATIVSGTSGMTFSTQYSSDYNPSSPGAATWTYTPVSGGGGAPAGYDRNVKALRWNSTAGTLSNVSPNNTGYVTFDSRIK